MINYSEMEKKWQKVWDDAHAFESEPNDKQPLLVTAAIPYVNSPPHIGHLRTYGTADTYARYMRMKGYNVLYPFGFHATGTPVVGYAKRIANGDKDLIDDLKLFHVSDEDIRKMVDPVYIADYFIKQQEIELRKAGLGIDWRRKFITTEPLFSKLVEWQFYKLKEKGYLTQGTHPVGWCPNENNAVGQHDTLHDVQPKIEEVLAVKFKDKDSDIYFPCATYRPETIYGATNIFVGEKVSYVVARVDNERFYLSKDAVFTLSYQFDIRTERDVPVSELLTKRAINPVTKEEVPVLPGFFVKGEVGTGIVMSVPSHAPFDYAAIERLKAGGYKLPEMQYKKLIEIEAIHGRTIGRSLSEGEVAGVSRPAHPEVPALAYLELLNANPNSLDDMLEFATKLIYREESRWGVMLVGSYKGRKETEAREGLKKELVASKDAISVYELTNEEEVICRCNTKVVVNIVRDQWFINYGNEQWKGQVRAWLAKMKLYPEKYRHTFETVIDWIEERATERAQGLGTRFPFNPSHIIESLSDSTIYMIFYTFDHVLRSANIQPEQLKPEFFEYMVNNVGDGAGVARLTGIDELAIKKCKESLDYWYTNTSRHSAPDLVYNHFVMYIFNHVALFPEKWWPRQIVTNGFVNYEGEKMSKSLGNIVPLGDGVEKYGSDPLRFIEIAGAELDTETEFSMEALNSVLGRNEFIMGLVNQMGTMKGVELEHIDYWLYSKLNTKIRDATVRMDRLEYKGAYTEIYYNAVSDLKWYLERGGKNQVVVREYVESMLRMLAPIMPHFAEEVWHTLANTSLVIQERWPEANLEMINEAAEAIEDVLLGTIDDTLQAIALTSKIDANKGKGVKEIKIIVSDYWKLPAINALIEQRDIGKVMRDPKFKDMNREALSKFLGQFMGKINTMSKIPEMSMEELYSSFIFSRDYLKKRLGAEVTVEKEADTKSQRAARSLPNRPSIDIIWG